MSAMQKLVEQMQAECLQIHADHTAQMAKLEDELAAKQRVLEQKREEVERLREERTIEDDHTKHYRSILICYFPRECSEADIHDAFRDYCDVESVRLVAKNGTPKCFGFVNWAQNKQYK